MKQVFLIHAHKDLDQLNTLVGQLCDDDFLLYVHLDRKCGIDPARVHPAARLVTRRTDVRWGGFSQVRATLNSLRQVLAEVPAFDKVIFLSAQDFPLLPNARLKHELAALADRELLDAVPIREGGWPVAFRYQYFYREGANRLERAACALANRALRALKRRRRMVRGLAPWGGSSWWALSRGCVAMLLETAARDRKLMRFFATVQCPDEMFFQTVVMNSPWRERVLGENFRHIQWPEHGSRNPKILDEADFERIAAARAHFCRKLDSRGSARLLPRLRGLLASRAGRPA
jgi:Core-2/I-Branching enzyme